jgi:hypothetical protein
LALIILLAPLHVVRKIDKAGARRREATRAVLSTGKARTRES